MSYCFELFYDWSSSRLNYSNSISSDELNLYSFMIQLFVFQFPFSDVCERITNPAASALIDSGFFLLFGKALHLHSLYRNTMESLGEREMLCGNVSQRRVFPR